MFGLAKTLGGLPFWHLQRVDAQRAVIVADFADAFALNHADKIAAPLVGAALMGYGPKGMSSGEFNEQMKDVQARCGVSANIMSSVFSVEAKPEDIAEALDACFHIVTEPALRDKDIERLRKSSADGRARQEQDRGSLAGLVMRQLVLVNGPFGRWSEPDEVAKITAGDADLWRREVFARDNLTIVAVGAQDAAAFGVMIDKNFSQLPEKAAVKAGVAPAPVYPAKTIVLEREGAQTAIVLENAVNIEASEGPAVTIGNNVLGGGMDRRLGKAVRGEQGATYGIGSGIGQAAPGQRSFSIRSALANDLAAGGLKRAREEYENWRLNGVSEVENEASRSLLATSIDKGAAEPGGKAYALVNMLRTSRTAEDEALYTERMRATPAIEVNRVLRARMPEKLTTVIVAPKADGYNADCVIRDVKEVARCR